METPYFSGRSWLVVVLFSFLTASLGFFSLVTLDSTRFLEFDDLSRAHLIYALQLKDDMALIDWSKAMERSPSIKVFCLKTEGKPPLLGKNASLSIPHTPDGLCYRFPFDWVDRFPLKVADTSLELTLFHQDTLFPLVFAVVFSTIPFLLAGFLKLLRPKPSGISHPPITSSSSPAPSTPTTKITRTIESKEALFTLDSDYIIREATLAAAQELGKELPILINSHFLDLAPDPSVMRAIEEGRETRLLKPFPSHPHLCVHLQPTQTGWTLRLELMPEVERA